MPIPVTRERIGWFNDRVFIVKHVCCYNYLSYQGTEIKPFPGVLFTGLRILNAKRSPGGFWTSFRQVKSSDSLGKDHIHVEGLLLFLEPIGHLPSHSGELK